MTYDYQCANGSRFSTSFPYCYLYDNGQCSGASGNPGGSGSGGTAYYGPPPGGGGGGGGGSGPSLEPIKGVKCWPVAERREAFFDLVKTLKNAWQWFKDTLQDVMFYVGCSVNAVTREYNDEATDLSVKTPGGSLGVQRLFYGNEWHWEYTRNNLQFGWDSLGQYIEIHRKGGRSLSTFGDGNDPCRFCPRYLPDHPAGSRVPVGR